MDLSKIKYHQYTPQKKKVEIVFADADKLPTIRLTCSEDTVVRNETAETKEEGSTKAAETKKETCGDDGHYKHSVEESKEDELLPLEEIERRLTRLLAMKALHEKRNNTAIQQGLDSCKQNQNVS